jgi:hypothetical protein
MASAIDPPPELDLLLLHGSRARSTAAAESDHDVAAFIAPGSRVPLALVAAVEEVAEGLVGGAVDLGIVTTQSDPLYAFEAMKQGRVLWARDDEAYPRWRSLVGRLYADTAWLRRRERQAVRRRFGGKP